MFWKIFLDLCLKKGVTPTAAGLEIGLNAATVSRWKRGAIPNEITLIKISQYFGVSVDYLLGKEPEEEKAPASGKDDSVDDLISYLEELRSNPDMRMLFSLMKGATKEDVQKAVEIIKILRGTGNG